MDSGDDVCYNADGNGCALSQSSDGRLLTQPPVPSNFPFWNALFSVRRLDAFSLRPLPPATS